MKCPFCKSRMKKKTKDLYECHACEYTVNTDLQKAVINKQEIVHLLQHMYDSQPDLVLANAQLGTPEFDINSVVFINKRDSSFRKHINSNTPITLIAFEGVFSLLFDRMLASFLSTDSYRFEKYSAMSLYYNNSELFLYLLFLLENGVFAPPIEKNLEIFNTVNGVKLDAEATLYNFMTSPLRHLLQGYELDSAFEDIVPTYDLQADIPEDEPDKQCYEFYKTVLISRDPRNKFIVGGLDTSYTFLLENNRFNMKVYKFYKTLATLAAKYRKQL